MLVWMHYCPWIWGYRHWWGACYHFDTPWYV